VFRGFRSSLHELIKDRGGFDDLNAQPTPSHFTLNPASLHFQYTYAIGKIADSIQDMAKTPFPFERLPAELRAHVYKSLHCTTKYAIARRNKTREPVIVVGFSYIERAIVAVSKAIRNEAEKVIDEETQKCGPAQLIVDCDYFHFVPEVLADIRNARQGYVPPNMGLADDERENFDTIFTRRNLVEQARMDAVMYQMWTRLANLYLKTNERIEVGVWIGNDAACETFVELLPSAIEDIINPRWDASDTGMYRPKFAVTIECSEEVESDVEDIVQDFEDARFEVSEELEPEEMESRWSLKTFDGVFEEKELSSDESSEDSDGELD